MLLVTGTRHLQIVFIVKLLILLRNISRLHWNRELYSLEVCRCDSRQYTAKLVLTYANTVCGISGVGEFGECALPAEAKGTPKA